MPQLQAIERLRQHLQEPQTPGVRIGPITFTPDAQPNTFDIRTFRVDRTWLGGSTFYIAKEPALSFEAFSPEDTLRNNQLYVSQREDPSEIKNPEPQTLPQKSTVGKGLFIIEVDSQRSLTGTCFNSADFLLMQNGITPKYQYQFSLFNRRNRTVYL